MTKPEAWPKACARCCAPLSASSMSFFNEDICCEACLEDERQAPHYHEARAAEESNVRHGNYSYRGLGLSPADRSFISERLIARGIQTDADGLSSLETPPLGDFCPKCGNLRGVVDFCAVCHELKGEP